MRERERAMQNTTTILTTTPSRVASNKPAVKKLLAPAVHYLGRLLHKAQGALGIHHQTKLTRGAHLTEHTQGALGIHHPPPDQSLQQAVTIGGGALLAFAAAIHRQLVDLCVALVTRPQPMPDPHPCVARSRLGFGHSHWTGRGLEKATRENNS